MPSSSQSEARRSTELIAWVALTVLVLGGGAAWYALGGKPQPLSPVTPGSEEVSAKWPEHALGPATLERQRGNPFELDKKVGSGLTALHRRLGVDAPTAAGIRFGHVEGQRGQHLPNQGSPRLRHLTIVPRSGPSQVFNHATYTAVQAFAPDFAARDAESVHSFSTRHWMTDGYLQAGRSELPLTGHGIRVFNHSWISLAVNTAAPITRRLDYDIDTNDTVHVAGVSNAKGAPIPVLLSHAHNVIAVGEARGQHSAGLTRLETAGRMKPELVGPGKTTSFTTPWVTAAAGVLMQQAERGLQHNRLDFAGADRSETIKAVLLAGASKPTGWTPEPAQPLHPVFGAGLIHLDRSVHILEHPGTAGDRITDRFGWRFAELSTLSNHDLMIRIEEPVGPVCVAMTWHRRFNTFVQTVPQSGNGPPRQVRVFEPKTVDFNLELSRLDGAETVVLAQSVSERDNVEQLVLPALEPGSYRLRVSRMLDGYDEPWDYALAWRVESAEEPVAPADETGLDSG